MRLNKKSLSKVTLSDLLRRKKTNLESFLQETGIVTYELLRSRCGSIGVVPPTEEEFLRVKGNPVTHEVSSPMEGIVVMNPPQDRAEETNSFSEVEVQSQDSEETVLLSSLEDASKKKKKKKETTT